MDFLDDCKILMSSKNKSAPKWGRQLTQRDARLAFFLSRFTVIDEVKHRARTMSLDKLEFFECLCRCSEMLSEELPMAVDLEEKECLDMIEFEHALNRDGKLIEDAEKKAALAAQMAKKKQQRRPSYAARQSTDYRNNEDEDDNDGDNDDGMSGVSGDDNNGEGKGDKQEEAPAAPSLRTRMLLARRLYERVDMFLRLIGGRLGMRYNGQLQLGKQFLRFVPRYIADAATFKLVT